MAALEKVLEQKSGPSAMAVLKALQDWLAHPELMLAQELRPHESVRSEANEEVTLVTKKGCRLVLSKSITPYGTRLITFISTGARYLLAHNVSVGEEHEGGYPDYDAYEGIRHTLKLSRLAKDVDPTKIDATNSYKVPDGCTDAELAIETEEDPLGKAGWTKTTMFGKKNDALFEKLLSV